jgi:hypothetical protein
MPTRSPKGKVMICSALAAFELVSGLLSNAISVSAATPEVSATPVDYTCNVFELRQYTLKPAQRDILIELFDREFVETQEAVGMRICGQFRDEDHPDRFVWIRAFADMEARERALTSFYGGPAWKAHGRQAAATMIDSDNVLLLHPVDPPGGFNDLPAKRPTIGAPTPPSALVTPRSTASVPIIAVSLQLSFANGSCPRCASPESRLELSSPASIRRILIRRYPSAKERRWSSGSLPLRTPKRWRRASTDCRGRTAGRM